MNMHEILCKFLSGLTKRRSNNQEVSKAKYYQRVVHVLYWYKQHVQYKELPISMAQSKEQSSTRRMRSFEFNFCLRCSGNKRNQINAPTPIPSSHIRKCLFPGCCCIVSIVVLNRYCRLQSEGTGSGHLEMLFTRVPTEITMHYMHLNIGSCQGSLGPHARYQQLTSISILSISHQVLWLLPEFQVTVMLMTKWI